MNEPYHTLISAAILAPSGDNMQPWRFEVDECRAAITVFVDETRDRSPMNAGQRMSRIACGAAIENMMRTAAHNGWNVDLEMHGEPLRLATLHVDSSETNKGRIEEVLRERHTDRRAYDGRPLPPNALEQLRRVETLPGVDVHWVVDPLFKRHFSKVIGVADALMFGDPSFLRAFLDNVRFDRPADEEVDEGLSIGSLGLSRIDRWLLPLLRYASGSILRSMPLQDAFARKARRLINSAAGLCVLYAAADDQETDVAVGRVMQRAWQTASYLGLQVQPMMSLPVLDGAMTHGILNEEKRNLLARKTATLPANNSQCRRISAIFRFGRGTKVCARVARRLPGCIHLASQDAPRWIASVLPNGTT